MVVRALSCVALLALLAHGACKQEEREVVTTDVVPGPGPGPSGGPGTGGGDGVGGDGGFAGMGGIDIGGMGGTGGGPLGNCDQTGNCAACANCAHVFDCNGAWIDCNNDPDCQSSVLCLQQCNQSCIEDDCYLACRNVCSGDPGFGQAIGYLNCVCNVSCASDCATQQVRDCIQFAQ